MTPCACGLSVPHEPRSLGYEPPEIADAVLTLYPDTNTKETDR